MANRSGRVSIDSTGAVRALGGDAARRLATRSGEFTVLPSPPEMVVMKRVTPPGERAAPVRLCRLSGEIIAPGAICDVVAFVSYAKWLGELVVVDSSSSRSVFFDSDHVVSARSSVENERLGNVLFRHGALTRSQVTAAATESHRAQVRFGEAVVKLGFLGAEEVFNLMEVQAREVFDAVLRAGSGMFYFLDGFEERILSYRMRTPVSVMLTDGVRRMDEMKYFRERIPSGDHVPALMPGHVPPDAGPNRVYAAVDGVRSVHEICRVVRSDEFEVTRSLFELAQAGYVVMRPPRPEGPAAVVEVFNKAMVLLMRELDAMDVGDEVREQLVQFASEGGIYDALFAGAGPADDGSLDAERIEQNFARLSAPRDAEYLLAEWLHDYASYAMFLARPHLQRADEGLPAPSARRPTIREKRRLSETFRAVLSSIAPPACAEDDLPPASRRRI
jgi:hypothetical protein